MTPLGQQPPECDPSNCFGQEDTQQDLQLCPRHCPGKRSKKQGRVGERWVWDETDKKTLTGCWGAGRRFTRGRTCVLTGAGQRFTRGRTCVLTAGSYCCIADTDTSHKQLSSSEK